MKLVIECVERIGIVQQLLSLLSAQQINLEAIEVEKRGHYGFIFLRTPPLDLAQETQLISHIQQLEPILSVEKIDYLPQERKHLELQAVLEALPNPVLSLDIQGKVTFANSQACKVLLPIFYRNLTQKQQQHASTLTSIALNRILPTLNRTKWYAAYLQQGQDAQTQMPPPLSHTIQFNGQIWQIELFPLALSENGQNHVVGYVVNLQLPQKMQLNLRQFMVNQEKGFDQIITQSSKMLAVMAQAKKFALLNAPLLIQGETGTGKDLFAKACHQFSLRRDKKFIAVNCAGLPPEEAESEMFGYRGKGKEAIGFFENAHGGTVLLDSIAELSLEMQAKLLRFLNDGVFRRVGEENEIQVDVRVICTSQKPLALLVDEGKLREDLYHRLNVLTLTLPPLRERREDLPLLTDHFIKEICEELNITVPQYAPSFVQAIQNHHWRGNLRELYNAIYRACSLADEQLSVADLNLPDAIYKEMDLDDLQHYSLDELVNRFEASLLRKFYAEYPSTRKLAQRLGLSHTAVANKLRLYGIKK